MQLVIDSETNGFVEQLDRLHSLVIRDAETSEIVLSCADQPGYAPIREGLALMEKADLVSAHNWWGFDALAIKKVYPNFKTKARIVDTLAVSRVVFPADLLRDEDFKRNKKGKLPGQHIGNHSIEAWGYRLGATKVGTDIKDWSTWTPYMHERCESDTIVGVKLFQHLMAQPCPPDVLDMEGRVAEILIRQERRGFAFDRAAAERLAATLIKRQAELTEELQTLFPPWEVRTPFTPKANNKARGYVKGELTHKVKTVVFNPGSRDHIADRLTTLHGWKPVEFTDGGKSGKPKPKVDETTIAGLRFPGVKALQEYLLVGKRLGQLCDGKEALMKHLAADGRIHGRVNPNGANTFRMTHMKPNMSQVPASRSAYGHEFRECLMAGTAIIDGVLTQLVLVGADADALELRLLAGYMQPYDGGAYIRTVLEGRKEDGTDMHSVNARALGLDPVKTYRVGGQTPTGREIAKVYFYAFLYGAGDHKLGTILGVTGSDAKIRNAGKATRAKLLRGLPALAKLIEKIKAKLLRVGYLKAIDGRRLYSRSEHSALNTLLQSAGGILMKWALVFLDDALQAAGLVPGVHYEFVANSHDEWQIETMEQHAEFIGQQARDAIAAAGKRFAFPCPLAGDHKVGRTWADTH